MFTTNDTTTRSQNFHSFPFFFQLSSPSSIIPITAKDKRKLHHGGATWRKFFTQQTQSKAKLASAAHGKGTFTRSKSTATLTTSNVKSRFMRIHCKSRFIKCWGRICCTLDSSYSLLPLHFMFKDGRQIRRQSNVMQFTREDSFNAMTHTTERAMQKFPLI
jgi:hypothetical protein